MMFNYSYNQFKALYGNKINVYLDGIGGFIREDNVSDSRIDTAMRTLAQASNGRAMKNPLEVFQAFQGDIHNINWLDAAAFVAVESGKDILNGAETIGNSVIFTGKMLTYLLPVIALVFVFFFINSKTNNQLLKALKK